MPVIALFSLLGCVSDSASPSSAQLSVKNVNWTQGGVETALEDAQLRFFGTSSSADETCEPTTRLHLMGLADTYQAVIDLASYASGAAVITPAPPLGDWPPTLISHEPPAEDENIFWSGGPASFAIDTSAPEPVHTLTLEAPTTCTGHWRDVEPEDCAPDDAITFRFTGALDQITLIHCDTQGQPGTELAPSGLPYCLPDLESETWEVCGGTGAPSDVPQLP